MKISSWVRSIRSLPGQRSGAAAIEFALLAPLVLVLIFSTLEAGWIMTQSMMLDTAVNRASRTLQIGGTSMTYVQFKAAVCSEAVVLKNCAKRISIELTPIDKAADIPTAATPCVDRVLNIDPVTTFKVGKGSQIVYGRACFVVDPLTPGLGLGLSLPKDKSGGLRLTARFAFVNEPT